MKKISVLIIEESTSWYWSDGQEARSYPSAAEAQKATRELGEATAPSMISVTWKPTTPIGARILRALGVSK